MTISSSITLNSGAVLVFNNGYSVVKSSGGAINKASGAAIKKTNLWMVDADADGWPASSTQTASDNSPGGNYRRKYLMNTSSFTLATGVWTLDCNDSANSPTNSCCAANYGQACSACNSCGTCNNGTYLCNGACSVSAPGLPYSSTCSACNSCGSCNSGTQDPCTGTGCTAVAPANPYLSTCSICNACGTCNSGTQNPCTGTGCTATLPPLPAGYGTSCSACNSCGSCNSGTIGCNGCSVSAPADPYYIGQYCGPYCNSCNVCTGTGGCTNVCTCACSTGGPPPTYCETIGCYAGCSDPCICP